MAFIRMILFTLITIKFFSGIFSTNFTFKGLSPSSNKSIEKVDSIISLNKNYLKENVIISENVSNVTVFNNLLLNEMSINKTNEGSKTENFTENNFEEELGSTVDMENSHQFFTYSIELNTDISTLVPQNSSSIDEVLIYSTDHNDNYYPANISDTPLDKKEGPLIDFNTLNGSESMDYNLIEEEEIPLMTLIWNELRANSSYGQNLSPDEKFVESFIKMGRISNRVMKHLTPFIVDKILTANISFQCFRDLTRVYDGLNTNQHWVFQLLDSNGHLPSGMLSGTLTSLGDYDQCLSVKDNETEIRGKYCLMKIKSELPKKSKVITFKDKLINLNGTVLQNTWIDKDLVKNLYNFYYFSITNGICVPSSCTQIDLVNILEQFLGPFHLQIEVENCAVKVDSSLELNFGQTIALVIVLSFVVISVLATILNEIFVSNSHKYRNYFTQIIECFSLKENIRKLFDTSSPVSHKSHYYNLKFIDGIKVLSMMWIITGHTYISGAIFFNKDIPTANFYFANLVDTINLPKQLFTQFVFNGLLAVDTFFFISGLLVIYLTVIKINEHGQSFSFISFIFLRWIRFIPLLIAIISMNLLWPLLGSGPLFHENYIRFITDPCYKFWWRNLLFISNWYPVEEQCMIHTWYISADFQYYIIAFFIIKLTSSNINKGIMASLFMVILGVVIPTMVGFYYNLPPTILYQADIENMALHASLLHFQPYNHITSFFLGALLACLLLKKTKFYVPQIYRYILWSVSCVGSLFVVFITYIWTSLEWEYPRIGAALYFGTHRLIWSLSMAWITLNCAQNKAGIVNSILSSNIFKITSRLTFSIYMSHMIILWFNFFRIKHLLFSTHYDMLFTAAGVYVLTLIFALLNHILFELPILNLVKYIIDTKMFINKNSQGYNKEKKIRMT